MDIFALKDKCNSFYSNAIELLENNGPINEICQNLLESADYLVQISKIDILNRTECEQKAAKLLSVSKELRVSSDRSKAYFQLTGTVLKLNNEIDSIDYNDIKEVIKPVDKKIVETPIEFQFKWDNIPNVSFDDVAGLEEVKNTVFKKVILPLNNPELYDGYDKQNGGGLLLYGPPGTGKTMIAAALAHEIGAKFCSVRASDLVLSGIGNSEQAISKLFSEARSFKCAVIFFDEIDAICPAETRAQHAKQIRSELLSQMQGLDSYLSNSDNILFLVAATNKPWAIDTAFLRPGRFGIRTYVGLPSSEAKLAIIKNKLSKIEEHGVVKISENLDLDEIVTRTVDFNGADVANLMDEVQENSIMRSIKSGDKVILPEDFDLAFEKIKSSVIKEDLVKFSHWEENI